MSKTIQLGIMSGRLSNKIENKIQAFPVHTWKNEFNMAANCGFDSIEWIFDADNNPILEEDGLAEIKKLSKESGIKINSICCDYFMKSLLFNVSSFELQKNIETLKKLIERCARLEIEILEIPLVDSSSLKNQNEEIELQANIEKILPLAEKNGVNITLETDLAPSRFKELMSKFNSDHVYANYDTGNSASLGYNVKEEFNAIGHWIKNIHIKDRLYKGNSVPLGDGDTDFDLFFIELKKIHYKGDLIIQAARQDESESPELTCKKYLDFVKQYVHKYSI